MDTSKALAILDTVCAIRARSPGRQSVGGYAPSTYGPSAAQFQPASGMRPASPQPSGPVGDAAFGAQAPQTPPCLPTARANCTSGRTTCYLDAPQAVGKCPQPFKGFVCADADAGLGLCYSPTNPNAPKPPTTRAGYSLAGTFSL